MLEGKASDGRKLLRDVGGDLELTIYDAGTAVDATGTPTVTVTRADGTAIATDAVTTKPGATTGIYRFTLTAANVPEVDLLKAVWSATINGVARQFVTFHEVVGAFYVTESDVRAFDTNLSNATKFPDDRIKAVIDWFEDLAEEFCHVSFVPRYAREVLDGDGSVTIWLPKRPIRSILSAKVDGATITDLTEWKVYPHGKVIRDDGSSFTDDLRNVEITYEHGLDEPPADVREAALRAVHSKLLVDKSTVPERTVMLQAGGQVGSRTIPFAVDESHPTGVPSVDTTLNEHRRVVPGVA